MLVPNIPPTSPLAKEVPLGIQSFLSDAQTRQRWDVDTATKRNTNQHIGRNKTDCGENKERSGQRGREKSLSPEPLSRRAEKKNRPEDTDEPASRGGCRNCPANVLHHDFQPRNGRCGQ